MATENFIDSVPDGFGDSQTFEIEEDDGTTQESLVRPEDIRTTIPEEELEHLDLDDGEAYWLEEGYSFALIARSKKDNEYRYFVVQPYLSQREKILIQFLRDKLRQEINYDTLPVDLDDKQIIETIQKNVFKLLRRWDYVPRGVLRGKLDSEVYDVEAEDVFSDRASGLSGKLIRLFSGFLSPTYEEQNHESERQEEDQLTPEELIRMDEDEKEKIADEISPLSPKQIDKIVYYLLRDHIRLGKITPLKEDVNIEDISVDGYDSDCWIYHSDYGNLRTNIHFNEHELDKLVKYMAQSDGKGISKRQPTVDATLDDGSRVQLTLSDEVTEEGSAFTIRQFKDIPFTPIDLIHWRTYSIEEMAYLWMAVQYGQNIIFAGETASGKTTTLNACSLFIANQKIVSIEDTPELTLPHDNWVRHTTRETDEYSTVKSYEEFDLMEESMRERPGYILLGEVRDKSAATALFQTISSGHRSMTTFHGGSAEGVINRFTNEPMEIAPAQFDGIDLLCLQEPLKVGSTDAKRRARKIVEIKGYDPDKNDVQRNTAFEWDPVTDEHQKQGEPHILQKIKRRNGWSNQESIREFFERQVVLSYLIRNGIQEYAEVAGVIQAYMRDSDAIMEAIATDELEDYVSNLKELSSLDIDVDEESEELLNRPVSEEAVKEAENVLSKSEQLLEDATGVNTSSTFTSGGAEDTESASNPVEKEVDAAREAALARNNGDSGSPQEAEQNDSITGSTGVQEESEIQNLSVAEQDETSGLETNGHDSDGDIATQNENGDERNHETKEVEVEKPPSTEEEEPQEPTAESESGGILSKINPFSSSGKSENDEQSSSEDDVPDESNLEPDHSNKTSNSDNSGLNRSGSDKETVDQQQTSNNTNSSESDAGVDEFNSSPDASKSTPGTEVSATGSEQKTPDKDPTADETISESVDVDDTLQAGADDENRRHLEDEFFEDESIESAGQDAVDSAEAEPAKENLESSLDSERSQRTSNGQDGPSEEKSQKDESWQQSDSGTTGDSAADVDADSSSTVESKDNGHSEDNEDEDIEEIVGDVSNPFAEAPEEDGASGGEVQDPFETAGESKESSPKKQDTDLEEQPDNPFAQETTTESSDRTDEQTVTEDKMENGSSHETQKNDSEKPDDPFEAIDDDGGPRESDDSETNRNEGLSNSTEVGESESATSSTEEPVESSSEPHSSGSVAKESDTTEQDNSDVDSEAEMGSDSINKEPETDSDDTGDMADPFKSIGEIKNEAAKNADEGEGVSNSKSDESDTSEDDDSPSENSEVRADEPDENVEELDPHEVLKSISRGEEINGAERAAILKLPTIAENSSDVLLEPEDCLETIEVEEWGVYKQCENPPSEGNFCHFHHPNRAEIDGGK